MTALPWLNTNDMLDMLRCGSENEGIIKGLAVTVPGYIEHETGYPSAKVSSDECDSTAQLLAKFLLMLWYAPDGLDADRLQRTIDSLTCVLRRKVTLGVTEK